MTFIQTWFCHFKRFVHVFSCFICCLVLFLACFNNHSWSRHPFFLVGPPHCVYFVYTWDRTISEQTTFEQPMKTAYWSKPFVAMFFNFTLVAKVDITLGKLTIGYLTIGHVKHHDISRCSNNQGSTSWISSCCQPCALYSVHATHPLENKCLNRKPVFFKGCSFKK